MRTLLSNYLQTQNKTKRLLFQINYMKSTRQSIKEAKQAISQRFQNSHLDTSFSDNNELTPFQLMPIEFTGMIEDYLFQENAEIFNMLKQQSDQDIEGLTYSQIKLNEAKHNFYQNVISNIPKYYSLKPSDRLKHFQIQGQKYLQKMTLPHLSSSNASATESPKKSKIDIREPTPIKTIKISKKQALNNKKNSRKQHMKQKPQLTHQHSQTPNLQQPNNVQNENVYSTPPKRMKQKKTVKFFQFEYVKDFSQYKTPKQLESLEEYIEPLKEIEPNKKQE